MTTLLWCFAMSVWMFAWPCAAQAADEAVAEPVPAAVAVPTPVAVAVVPGREQAPVTAPPIVVASTPVPVPAAVKPAARFIIDDFEGSDIENTIGGRTNVFQKAPSKAMISRRDDVIDGRRTRVLLVRYDKQAEGGPYGMGGWCGYYTTLKKPGHLIAPTPGAAGQSDRSEEQYWDGSAHTTITFWVRGERGGESFMIGLSDRHWDKVGDSVKSEVIGKYLPAGKVTTQWQKAVVPLDTFFVDYAKLGSIAISFESDAFPDGQGAGTIYLDDLAFE